MIDLNMRRGGLVARVAQTEEEVRAALRLRAGAFGRAGSDRDEYDALSSHLIVWRDSEALACCRIRLLQGPEVASCYTSAFYDLSSLARHHPGPMLEIGRVCMLPGPPVPDALRLMWGALAAIVLQAGAGVMFGCASFPGTDVARHAKGLAALRRYVGPADRRPEVTAADHVALADLPEVEDVGAAMAEVPALLRSYLGMGGWVSSGAVVDHDLNTIHVFVAVEVDRIPPSRARVLHKLAGVDLG